MWQILKTLLVQGILAKTLLRSFGWLGWLLPVGAILKWIGLPLLSVLGVLALPVPVRALFERDAAHETTLRNLLSYPSVTATSISSSTACNSSPPIPCGSTTSRSSSNSVLA